MDEGESLLVRGEWVGRYEGVGSSSGFIPRESEVRGSQAFLSEGLPAIFPE